MGAGLRPTLKCVELPPDPKMRASAPPDKSLNGPSTFSGPARVLARMGRSWVVHSGVESWVAASGVAQIVGPPTVSSITWQGRMSKGATFSHGTIAVRPVGQERTDAVTAPSAHE